MLINKLHVLTFLAVLVLAALAQAQTFTALYYFTGGSDGASPLAALTPDKARNLYGTTNLGGDLENCAPSGCGVVFKLDEAGHETVLWTFTGGNDGGNPGSGLVLDSAGNLYGTTFYGGAEQCGVVFKIDAAGKESVLHAFTGADGCNPAQGLVMDKARNLYGTTAFSAFSYGTVFKLDSAGNETILHKFGGGSSDGASPYMGHLLMDEAGNLYGVTYYGGSTGCTYGSSCGVLYKLSKKGTFTLLHRFAGGTSDGCNPFGTVAIDKKGNLYGTTSYCGSSGGDGFGTVWKVNKTGTETILHNFAGGTSDGCNPYAGVVRDSEGNSYGTTMSCGTSIDGGTVWKLSAEGTLTLLHSFDWSDGARPDGEVLRTANGELFGTTSDGGSGNGYYLGTVWSYKP